MQFRSWWNIPYVTSLKRLRDLRNLSFVFMDWFSLFAHRSFPSTNNNRWTNAEFDLGDLSRWQSLVSPAGSSEIMLGSFRMLDFEFPPCRDLLLLYFYSFKHARLLYEIFRGHFVETVYYSYANMYWEVYHTLIVNIISAIIHLIIGITMFIRVNAR